MPKRKSKGIMVHASKFRKNGLVISKSSLKSISSEARMKHGTLDFAEIQIGKSRFIPNVRGDKRIEIPMRVIKRENLKSGNFRVNIVRIEGGSRTRERRIFGKKKFPISRNYARTNTNYYVIPVEEVNLQVLKAEIFRDVYAMKDKGSHFYFRLNFLIIPEKQLKEPPLAFVRTFPETESYLIKKNPTFVGKMIDKFVDDVFMEIITILTSRTSPTEQIFFVDYSISFIRIFTTGLAIKGRDRSQI